MMHWRLGASDRGFFCLPLPPRLLAVAPFGALGPACPYLPCSCLTTAVMTGLHWWGEARVLLLLFTPSGSLDTAERVQAECGGPEASSVPGWQYFGTVSRWLHRVRVPIPETEVYFCLAVAVCWGLPICHELGHRAHGMGKLTSPPQPGHSTRVQPLGGGRTHQPGRSYLC